MRSTQPAHGSYFRFTLADFDEVGLGRGDCGHSSQQHDGRRWLKVGIDDDRMSTQHVRLTRTPTNEWQLEDSGSKNGTWVNGIPTGISVLHDGDLIETGRTFFLFRQDSFVQADDPVVFDTAETDLPLAFVTLHEQLAREFRTLMTIARSTSPLIIEGPSGSGKEVVARALHECSGRKGAFVGVNCAALTQSLFESQLFGHKRGAFSGATEDQPGLVRSSDGGTLFLDEVAELNESSQAALLRVLQEKEVLTVGAAAPIRVDLRVVSATHQDIASRITERRFREDFYARLSGFTISLPPLAERRADIGWLISRILGRSADATGVTFSRHATRALLAYSWPRNVRELEHAVNAAVTLCGGGEVDLEHLPEAVQGAGDRLGTMSSEAQRDMQAQLEQCLKQYDGNVSLAARALGKSRTYLHRLIKQYGIDVSLYRR